MYTLMCMGVLLACMSVHHAHVVPMDAGEGTRSPGTRVTDAWKLSCACWELNPVLLATKPPLLNIIFFGVKYAILRLFRWLLI